MASGIFAILDDIALLMDDTAAMSKVAAKKTAVLLGDDLAVNAEKATGFHASRELPVIWAIAKGALLNKIIILPLAFLLSAYAAWLIVPILLIGGAYLSYEGAEKIFEWLSSLKKNTVNTIKKPPAVAISDPNTLVEHEATKIKAAIRTDFILSVEIIVLALETVIDQTLLTQILVVGLIALIATIVVYGLVALMVRMDDTGLALQQSAANKKTPTAKVLHLAGTALIASLPKLVRLLMVIGTIAMLLVGGGMFVHNIEAVHHALDFMPGLLSEFSAGLITGGVLVVAIHLIKRLIPNKMT
jgi:predicted DNA repair protein MutK